MVPMRARRCAIAIAFCVMALTARADRAQIEDAVQGFYTAYAAGDLPAAKAFWTHEHAETFVTRHAGVLEKRCLRLERFRIDDVSIEGDAATASVDVLLIRWSSLPGAPIEYDPQRATLALRREQGRWRIDDWRQQEEVFAEQLAALESAAERETSLLARPDMQTPRMAEILSRRAVALVNRNNAAGAADLLALARTVAGALGDDAAMATVLSAESIVLRTHPNNERARALDAARTAVDMARFADPDTRARVLLRLGRALEGAGLDSAVDAYERALALSDHVVDASVVALLASQMARIHDVAGRPREAIRYAFQASDFARRSGDPASIISSEMNVAGALKGLGDPELGIPHLKSAVAAAERAGFAPIQADLLQALAGWEYLAGRGDRFLEASGRALEVLENASPAGRINVHRARSEYFLMELGDTASAEAELQQIGCLLEGAPTDDLNVLLAWLRMEQGRYEEALALLDRPGMAEGAPYNVRAALLRRLGRREEARRELELNIDKIEDRRGRIHERRLRRLYFVNAYSPYIDLVDLLVEDGDAREALAVAEMMKARLMRDILATGSEDSPDVEVEQREKRIVDLNRRLLEIQRDGGDTGAVRVQLRRARGELEEARMRAALAGPAVSPAPDPASVAIPEDTLAIEYVVGEKRTIVFAVRRGIDGIDVRAHTLDTSASELESLVGEFARAIEQRDARYRGAARRLYDVLLRPVLGTDPTETSVCIIPDGVLWRLPFQALVTAGGQHVIERLTIFYAPSLSMLSDDGSSSSSRRRPTVLALGDPQIDSDTKADVRALYRDSSLGRLPEAEWEVRELRRLYGERVTVLTGAVATESAFKREAGDYDVLHLATHGILDGHDPMYSALLLAGSDGDDGLLEAREILSLPLRAELVVLSACDTARGRVDGGEGVVGLSWAVLATGCPRAIAAQWRVGSSSAATLMTALHRRLARLKAVANVASSLREAQIEMLRSPRTAHPYDWAGFVLIGRER